MSRHGHGCGHEPNIGMATELIPDTVRTLKYTQPSSPTDFFDAALTEQRSLGFH